ncbi:MAG: hypothetical protein ACOY3U_12380, partial [Bacillota bacterium]
CPEIYLANRKLILSLRTLNITLIHGDYNKNGFSGQQNFIFSLYFFKLLPPTGQDIFFLPRSKRYQT